MGNYREYLNELKSTTLFQDIPDDELMKLLEVMQPPIRVRKAGEPMPGFAPGTFKMILRATPEQGTVPRQFKYDMPKFGEPGMLMAEIPALSRMAEGLPKNSRPSGPPHPHKDIDYTLEMLEFTPEMITKFYIADIVDAQSTMLRNFLGILAQKVCDVRHELFLIKGGRDMFQRRDETLQVFAGELFRDEVLRAVQIWNLDHPDLQAELRPLEELAERSDVIVDSEGARVSGSVKFVRQAPAFLELLKKV